MKKLLLFPTFAAFIFTAAQSQEFRLGVKAGVNLASVGGDETGNIDGLTSFHIGALVEIPISEKFSVQPELLYSIQGFSQSESVRYMDQTASHEYKLILNYINIPIMAKYYVINGLSVEAGPQIGFLVSAKSEEEETNNDETESYSEDLTKVFSTIDFGIGIGASYRLNMGVFFGARYTLGLSNINDFDGANFKNHNNVFQISAGYSF